MRNLCHTMQSVGEDLAKFEMIYLFPLKDLIKATRIFVFLQTHYVCNQCILVLITLLCINAGTCSSMQPFCTNLKHTTALWDKLLLQKYTAQHREKC